MSYKIIPIAVIWAKNDPSLEPHTINIIEENGRYFYQTFKGNKSKEYKSIAEGRQDIFETWGNWIDFKFVDQEV